MHYECNSSISQKPLKDYQLNNYAKFHYHISHQLQHMFTVCGFSCKQFVNENTSQQCSIELKLVALCKNNTMVCGTVFCPICTRACTKLVTANSVGLPCVPGSSSMHALKIKVLDALYITLCILQPAFS